MPIYEYRCAQCGAQSEEIRSISRAEDSGPDHCGAPMQRVPSAAGCQFMTAGGNPYNFTPSHGHVTKGNRKPQTIGYGHGLGGHKGRKPPTMREVFAGKDKP